MGWAILTDLFATSLRFSRFTYVHIIPRQEALQL
jgi:hypothetical protein